MRPLTLVALSAALVALAGCSSSSTAPKYDYGSPDLKQVESGFHADPRSNRTVSGEQVPLKFIDMNNKEVDLASFRGKSNVVLVVVKGMPQASNGAFCPGCLAQVSSLTANHDEFKKRSAEILMVFPGPSDKLPEFLATAKVNGTDGNPKVPFALLLDQDLNAVTKLGIKHDYARPSTFILDKKGDTVFAYVGETTTDRPSVKALLNQLDKLNDKK